MAERFWTADVQWETEPDQEELRRLQGLLTAKPAWALKGLQELSKQGSLAATLYIAIYLDCHMAEGRPNPEEVVNWYRKAAELGSRAALYQMGVKLSQMGRGLEAE